MAIYLSHADVAALLDMPEALDAVEAALPEHRDGTAVNLPRQRLRVPRGVLRSMTASLPSHGVMGTKVGLQNFDFAPGITKESVQVLYSTETGELLALFWTDLITDYRTGAAGGVSIRHLARHSASVVGVIGAGRQARTQLLAAAAARSLTEVRAYSPTAERRERYAAEMSQRLSVPVRPVSSAHEAVEGSDIVLAATSATAPVFDGSWLAPGAHVVSIRSSYRRDIASGRERRELDDTTIARADVLTVDSIEQALAQESPEVGAAIAAGRVVELGAVISGTAAGRTTDAQITLFKCFGMGLYDVAVAERVYRRAVAAGVGLPLPSPR